jgi:predicted DNA-binding protein (UPF0278 family)
MKKKNIYVVKLDSNVDEALKNFRSQLSKGETITETKVSENQLVIITETSKSKILTDQLVKG